MVKRKKISDILTANNPTDSVLVKGWIRTQRNSKGFSFVELNDGSCLKNIQIIVDDSIDNYGELSKLLTGSAVSVRGKIVASKGKGQKWEIQAEEVDIISTSPESFPLQKKRHSDEYLRTIAHLRPRTNKYGAVFRIRSEVSYAVHRFFRDHGFRYIHTPVLTGSDCEGAGDLFKVTTLNLESLPVSMGKTDYSKDFFGKEANLTVSGQLSAEMFALSLGDVYTFGPTFRAENSNTSRHVSEFWMIEPEMAFCDLEENMSVAEALLKYMIQHVKDNCEDDLSLFSRFVDKTLEQTLDNILLHDFERLPYIDVIDILLRSGEKFEYTPCFGNDLQTEHERFLTENYFKKPVMVFNYPKEIKPFYMRLNDDNKTVAAMDVLVPRIGEIVGGSQREERLGLLEKRMDEMGLSKNNYWWYLDSRRFGSVPHSGFGLGFERFIMLVTGISNIRDVIPFPRTPNSLEF